MRCADERVHRNLIAVGEPKFNGGIKLARRRVQLIDDFEVQHFFGFHREYPAMSSGHARSARAGARRAARLSPSSKQSRSRERALSFASQLSALIVERAIEHLRSAEP